MWQNLQPATVAHAASWAAAHRRSHPSRSRLPHCPQHLSLPAQPAQPPPPNCLQRLPCRQKHLPPATARCPDAPAGAPPFDPCCPALREDVASSAYFESVWGALPAAPQQPFACLAPPQRLHPRWLHCRLRPHRPSNAQLRPHVPLRRKYLRRPLPHARHARETALSLPSLQFPPRRPHAQHAMLTRRAILHATNGKRFSGLASCCGYYDKAQLPERRRALPEGALLASTRGTIGFVCSGRSALARPLAFLPREPAMAEPRSPVPPPASSSFAVELLYLVAAPFCLHRAADAYSQRSAGHPGPIIRCASCRRQLQDSPSERHTTTKAACTTNPNHPNIPRRGGGASGDLEAPKEGYPRVFASLPSSLSFFFVLDGHFCFR